MIRFAWGVLRSGGPRCCWVWSTTGHAELRAWLDERGLGELAEPTSDAARLLARTWCNVPRVVLYGAHLRHCQRSSLTRVQCIEEGYAWLRRARAARANLGMI